MKPRTVALVGAVNLVFGLWCVYQFHYGVAAGLFFPFPRFVLLLVGAVALLSAYTMLIDILRWWRAQPREDIAGLDRNADGTFGRTP